MQQHNSRILSTTFGTERQIVSYVFGHDDQQQVYIQAALHSDELPGVAVAWYLKHALSALESQGQLRAKVTLVPVANPIGFSQQLQGQPLGRFDSLSGQDFNRQFPAIGESLAAIAGPALSQDVSANKRVIREAIDRYFDDYIPATELQSQRAILMRMACKADLMIDIHCDWEAVAHLYTTPQAWPEVSVLGHYLGCRTALIADISGGEPFDEACAEPWYTLHQRFGAAYPLPAALKPVTLELRGARDVSHDQAREDARAILNGLTALGYIAGDVPPLPAVPAPLKADLAGCEYLTAPHAGVILYTRQPGEWIHAGEVAAEILDPITDQLTPLVCRQDGLLYARHWVRFATAGLLVVRLAGGKAGREGPLLVP
ncbi:succinylglutamate desuccinylase/aspartoacylase family protein [Tatumella terrea]|uniref:Succinylglutamate desuccinylase/aspartoacylase family protein n=1 Tax=Tatumella terrea TaxID=419007 RepID=A0ABW1W1V2_9GAMM